MLTSKDVMNKTLTPTQFHAGYEEREVDDLLDKVAGALRYYEQGGRPDSQALASLVGSEPEGLGQRALRWLRGDPRS
jgi:DivIVA domain-containing protein